MFSKKNLQNIATIFLIFIIQFSTLTNKSLAQNLSAYNDVRKTTTDDCDEDTEGEDEEKKDPKRTCYDSEYDENTEMCKTIPDFKFDPYGDNVDREWNFFNSSCLGYIYGVGMSLQLAFYNCDLLCPGPMAGSRTPKDALKSLTQSKFQALASKAATATTAVGSSAASATVSAVFGMPLDPLVMASLGWYGGQCTLALATAGATSSCCTALGICGGATAVAVAALASIWDIAKDNFYTTTICGASWKVWKQSGEGSKEKEWKTIDGNYSICLKKIFGKSPYCAPGISYDEDDKDCLPTLIKSPTCGNSLKNKPQHQYCKFTNYKAECSKVNVGDKNSKREYDNLHYREFIFQGIEYVDNGSNPCKNPKNDSKWEKTLGYKPTDNDGNQRYYFKGPNQRPNFACERFLNNNKKDIEALEAFTCCQKNSQKTICLERVKNSYNFNSDHKFCRIGEECTTTLNQAGMPVKYKISESETSKDHICAQTYTVCPYDHNVQGGTDKAKQYYYNPKIITNFCQYMNHCIKLPPLSEYPYYDPNTFYFAESCKDLRGDSQFFNENEVGKIPRFSSLYSRNFSAPIVQCFKETLENNFMQKAGKTICKDKDETPKKTREHPDGVCHGDSDSDYVQRKGQVINKTFFAKVQNRFSIPIKIALVLSVIMFGFNILLATPESFINKKTVMTYLVKFGLVYFFVLGNAWQGFFMDSVMNVSSEFANITFNPKSNTGDLSLDDGCDFPKYNYLSLLDEKPTPDKFKIDRSYPPGKSYLRIWDTLDCKLARAIGYGPDINVPNIAKMIFAGFITNGLGITFFFAAFAYALMLFSIAMRAIHITIMSIMGVILLIYVSPLTITCALFERTKGIFENWWKQMLGFILQPMILFAYLGLMLTVFDDLFIGDAKFNPPVNGNLPTINCKRDIPKNIRPDENSVYCILQLEQYKSFTGLEVFDLAIPVLASMTKEKINTLTRAAIIMFVFLKFLDTITTVAKKLVGGAELKAESTSEIQNQLKKIAKGVQKRVLNTTKKLATKTLPEAAKKRIRSEDKPMPKGEGEQKSPPATTNDIVGGD